MSKLKGVKELEKKQEEGTREGTREGIGRLTEAVRWAGGEERLKEELKGLLKLEMETSFMNKSYYPWLLIIIFKL